jgi:hypothetical protein
VVSIHGDKEMQRDVGKFDNGNPMSNLTEHGNMCSFSFFALFKELVIHSSVHSFNTWFNWGCLLAFHSAKYNIEISNTAVSLL